MPPVRASTLAVCLLGVVLTITGAVIAQPELINRERQHEQEEREELIRVAEQRLEVHESRARVLREQIQALQDGAEMETIRRALRAEIGSRTPRAAGSDRGPSRARPGRDDVEREERREARRAMSDERLMEFLRVRNPELHQRLTGLRESDPEVFAQLRERIRAHMRERFEQHGRAETVDLTVATLAAESALREQVMQIRSSAEVTQEQEAELRAALHAVAEARLELERATLEHRRLELERREDRLIALERRTDQFVEDRLRGILDGTEDFPPKPPHPERRREGRPPADAR